MQVVAGLHPSLHKSWHVLASTEARDATAECAGHKGVRTEEGVITDLRWLLGVRGGEIEAIRQLLIRCKPTGVEHSAVMLGWRVLPGLQNIQVLAQVAPRY